MVLPPTRIAHNDSAMKSREFLHKENIPAIKTASFSVTADESGMTYEIGAVDLVVTLPATARGLTYTFIVKTISATTGLSISPASVDKIIGNGFTAADDKDAINTAATDRVGDCITIVGDGLDGWYITNVMGTWARET